MPRTEDEWYGGTILIGNGFEECGDGIEPTYELLMLFATGEDVTNDGRVGHVPCCASGTRIARMPTEGDDAAALDMLNGFFSYPGERYRIKVLGIAHFDSAKVEAHESWEVADKLVGVGASAFPLPGDTIERIILVCIHIAFLTKIIETCDERLSRSRLCFTVRLSLLTAGGHQRHCKRGEKKNLFHIICGFRCSGFRYSGMPVFRYTVISEFRNNLNKENSYIITSTTCLPGIALMTLLSMTWPSTVTRLTPF